MIDTNADRDFDMSERQFAVSDGQRAYRVVVQQPGSRVRKGRLTKEEAAVRRSEAVKPGDLEVETAASEVQPEPESPRDPDAALRHARIGVVAVAVLILTLVWIMQRKRGV